LDTWSEGNDLVARDVKADQLWACFGVIEVAFDGLFDILAEFVEGVGLGEDRLADGPGREPPSISSSTTNTSSVIALSPQ